MSALFGTNFQLLNFEYVQTSYTLIELYDVLILVTNIQTYGKDSIDIHLTSMNDFKNKNFEDKLKSINKIIKINPNNNKLWENLKYVRNCITHNNSVVDKGDIKLRIPIFSLKMKDNVTNKIYKSSKEESAINIGNIKGHDATLKISWLSQEKIFKNGSTISFTQTEIYYLLFALKESIQNLEILFINFLAKREIEFGITKQNGIIKSQEELEKQYNYKKELHISLLPSDNKGAKA